ncbi:hypothetical protein [Tropicibacter sp. S64]|uniref:hypothetical protein n=1 Tax=Tropicibacter sp. S64 TaxID=3415122 RepID=UPI003C7E83DA
MIRHLVTGTTFALTLSATAQADQLFTDDIITTGNICAGGAECIDGEPFGATDIKIKGTIPELQFNDTSAGDSTWTVSVDDTSSGVFNGFSIKNETTFRYPVVIEEDAPTKALFISDSGMIGLQTTIPQASLHVVDKGALLEAAIRLEDTAGTSYSWDLRGNNAGFYVYDVDAGEIPFQIRPGAPDFAFEIASDGNVGVGTGSPDSQLHVRSASGNTRIHVQDTSLTPAVREMFKMSNNGGSYFTLDNTASGTTWYFTHEQNSPNRFIITDGVADGPEMTLSAEGLLTVQGGFAVGGTTLNVPDYVFGPEYTLRPLSEVKAFIDANRHLPEVPSAAEIEAEGLDMTEMQMTLLKKVEELTLYTLKQETQLKEAAALTERQAAETAALRRDLVQMLATVEQLQAVLADR